MRTALKQLQSMTVIVADTGDPSLVRRYAPVDCTTNPSLVLAAMQSEKSQDLIKQELSNAKANRDDVSTLSNTLTVAIGANLASLIPGRVSTEVDACLSFDIEGSVRRANEIVQDYERRGVSKDRILVKLASTWEGIRAAERLEKNGINCNLTLLFSLEQAKACADAGVYLISPFVGRITDWYKKSQGVDTYAPDQDPGVRSVREIFHYYKSAGITTIVMGASFRNSGQIKALAGCDRLTISPVLLEQLSNDTELVPRILSDDVQLDEDVSILDQTNFRWMMNQNTMATEKLAEGIRNFGSDHQKLLQLLSEKLS